MTSIDDLPLETGRGSDVAVTPSAPSSPGPRVVFFAVLAATLAAAVWVFVARSRPPSSGGSAAAVAAPATTVPDGSAPATTIALPPLAEMDPVVRGLLSALSSQPAMLQWLASDDLVGSIATAIARLAAGDSPARDLAVLKPGQGFATVRRGGGTRVDPTSYARYDGLVSAVTTVDPAKLATVFTTLKPRLVEAYAAHGFDAATFDQAVARALGVIVSTPDVPADAALTTGVGGYAFTDPEIERLPAAQRHLLRMGPAHVSAVRDAARRFAAALGVTPASS